VGNLYVATGNAELSKEMALNMMDQKVFIIKTFYSSDCSCAAVLRQYH
jgi:hypothetical protein